MSESNLEGVAKLFSFEKKQDLERYCRDLTIRSDDFFTLVLTCELLRYPFAHEISYQDQVPEHLVPSDFEIQALENTPAGTLLTGDAEKVVRKISQSFKERRYLVGHMFFTPDYANWHFFCFDQRDLETKGNHWKEGAHIHFINWLWPRQDAKSVWSNFMTEDQRPGGAIHLRFSDFAREKSMEIKKCEFDAPVEKVSSTGLHPRMFNQDVGFRFEVDIKVTERKEIEEMLNLFERATTDFKETWRKKLADLH